MPFLLHFYDNFTVILWDVLCFCDSVIFVNLGAGVFSSAADLTTWLKLASYLLLERAMVAAGVFFNQTILGEDFEVLPAYVALLVFVQGATQINI